MRASLPYAYRECLNTSKVWLDNVYLMKGESFIFPYRNTSEIFKCQFAKVNDMDFRSDTEMRNAHLSNNFIISSHL